MTMPRVIRNNSNKYALILPLVCVLAQLGLLYAFQGPFMNEENQNPFPKLGNLFLVLYLIQLIETVLVAKFRLWSSVSVVLFSVGVAFKFGLLFHSCFYPQLEQIFSPNFMSIVSETLLVHTALHEEVPPQALRKNIPVAQIFIFPLIFYVILFIFEASIILFGILRKSEPQEQKQRQNGFPILVGSLPELKPQSSIEQKDQIDDCSKPSSSNPPPSNTPETENCEAKEE
mmetsp:Transcript_14776/g.22067  ORF Transcript_14776/g.22067 Transcript_14776/m.22067 type:complete len:230 (-) Transcript_14776:129-818(-)